MREQEEKMFDGPIGKIILFWIFMIGALFFARALGFSGDTRQTVIFLIACALIYVVWVIGRTLAKRKKEAENYRPQSGSGSRRGRR